MSLVEASPRITRPKKMARHFLSAPMAAIEARRQSAKIEISALAVVASVPLRNYLRWRQTGFTPARPVLQRLTSALDRLERGGKAPGFDSNILQAVLGGFEAAALAMLPAHPSPLSPALRGEALGKARAALARHVAVYGANQFAGIPQAALASFLSLTPAAICLAIRRIETARDCPKFDSAMNAISRAVANQED